MPDQHGLGKTEVLRKRNNLFAGACRVASIAIAVTALALQRRIDALRSRRDGWPGLDAFRVVNPSVPRG